MWWLAVAALAQGLEGRQALLDALLEEAAHGNVLQAIEVYDRMARELPDQNPLRGEALYWLGHGHHQLGNVDAARRPLLEGIRSGLCPTRCRDLLEEVELEEARVDQLPVNWSFDDAEHGLFHPWRFQDRGSIRPSDGRLLWTTEPDPTQPDRLVMGFTAVGRVSSLSLKVEALRRDGALQVVIIDRAGDRFGLRDALRLTTGQAASVRLDAGDFVPVEGSGVLDPVSFSELWLVDITPQGADVVWALDQISIR